MQTLDDFYAGAQPLIDSVNVFVQQHALAGHALTDHICYKCGSSEEFERIRALLEPAAAFVYQSYISGRRIALIKLKEGFSTLLGEIALVELSDQKPDASQISHFDHIEIYPTAANYDDFVNYLSARGVALEKANRPHHPTYDILLGANIELKLTREPLLDKVKRDEMM